MSQYHSTCPHGLEQGRVGAAYAVAVQIKGCPRAERIKNRFIVNSTRVNNVRFGKGGFKFSTIARSVIPNSNQGFSAVYCGIQNFKYVVIGLYASNVAAGSSMISLP